MRSSVAQPSYAAFPETRIPIFERDGARLLMLLVVYEASMLIGAAAYGATTNHLLATLVGLGFLGTLFAGVVLFPVLYLLGGDRRSFLSKQVLTLHVDARGVSLHDASGTPLGSEASRSLSRSLVNVRPQRHTLAALRLDVPSAHVVLMPESARGPWSGAPIDHRMPKRVPDWLFDALLPR